MIAITRICKLYLHFFLFVLYFLILLQLSMQPGGKFRMERKKMTKALIGESLKVLMRNHPFEKITIKMITDEAGVIRPTFYNYCMYEERLCFLQESL